MDQEALLVWVDANPSIDPARAGSLCRRHADALTAPRGWVLDDRRDPIPRLFRVPENPTPADLTPGGGVRRRRKRVDSVDIPSLFADIAATAASAERMAGTPAGRDDGEPDTSAAASAEDDVDPDETKAIAWSPTLGTSDIDVPQGRLLGRAFGRRAQ